MPGALTGQDRPRLRAGQVRRVREGVGVVHGGVSRENGPLVIPHGKISVDIGATLGVGGSVSLEVDLSKTVNAVADGAKNVWSGLKSGAKKFFNW